MKAFSLLISGVGGQGTVLASKLIATAAMKCGFSARTTETIGMAQRGGCVFGHVRIGEEIFSPLIPKGSADVIIAFEPAEAARRLTYLSRNGALVVCDSAVNPVTGTYNADDMLKYVKSNASNVIIVRGQPIKEQCAKTLNTALLGAAAQCGLFPFSTEILLEVILAMPKFREENLKSFNLGREMYNEGQA
ncbi:MAG: indolepyruvate oxidoreductase subunit beta [Oscillospiraceae bacterium]|nr:indolepyruvate oxidoreductase subunit beta [Oscillospiraceae bacterium]